MIGVPTKVYCMKEVYELNKDRWYVEKDGVKIPNRPWQEFWCPKHKKVHNEIGDKHSR